MTTIFVLCCFLYVLNATIRVHSFSLCSKGGMKMLNWKSRHVSALLDTRTQEAKSSLDIIEQHLVGKTSVLAVFPKLAFTASKIEKFRETLANDHTWNSFLRKDQLTRLVSGKYWCPVLEHATAENWCIFLEDRLQEKQYKKLTTLITQEFDTTPYPVDIHGHPLPETRTRHKFMFCKKYHMIVIDGVEKGSSSIQDAIAESNTAAEGIDDWNEANIAGDVG